MERVGILVHPTRQVQDAVKILQRWTEDHGLGLVQIAAEGQPLVAPAGEVGGCDLVTALGGDGTILKALHAAARTETPVLGVACGSLGVLTTVPENELRAALDRFAAGDWLAHHLPALDVGAGGAHVAWAVNDLVLARRGGTQLVLDLCVDGELYARVAGDGIVVATPVGSSAYSMAAGGSVLAAGTNALVCTPLAMHGGCAPPLVLPDDRTVTIQIEPGHCGVDVEVDGLAVETGAHRFSVSSERGYATLVVLNGSRSGLAWLRERRLIADSPRVAAGEHQELNVRSEPDRATGAPGS